MIDPSIIDALVIAGASAEMIAAAHRADHVLEQARVTSRRAKATARKRRSRHALSRVNSVTERDISGHGVTERDQNPPSKVPPITPLNTPQGSEPKGSAPDGAADVVGEDPKARLFRIGKTALASFGVAEKRTGSLIGQWLKARNDPAGLLAAIQFARDQNVAEPVAYISTLVSGKGKPNGNGKQSLGELALDLADELRERERAAGIGRSPTA